METETLSTITTALTDVKSVASSTVSDLLKVTFQLNIYEILDEKNFEPLIEVQNL